MWAYVHENGDISIYRDKAEGLIPVVDQMPKVSEGEQLVDPSYKLSDDGTTVLAVWEVAPVVAATDPSSFILDEATIDRTRKDLAAANTISAVKNVMGSLLDALDPRIE